MEVVFVVLMLLTSSAGGVDEGLIHSFTEGQLLNSQLWKDDEIKLFIVEQDGDTVPPGVIEFVVKNFQKLPKDAAFVVKVLCEGEMPSGEGKVCSFFPHHHAIIKRGGRERGVVGVMNPSFKYENKMKYLIHILELMIGRAITHANSHSSLVSFVATQNECYLVVLLDNSSAEYASLLKLYLVEQPPLPLLVTSSKEFLPLSHRPAYSTKDPPLYLYNVLGSGHQWYKLAKLDHMEAFILRARYPAIVRLNKDRNSITEFLNQGIHLAVFFPGLPGYNQLNLEKFVEIIASKLYLSYIFLLADRGSDVAKRYSITNYQIFPQVVVLQMGIEKNPVSFEVTTDRMELEAQELADALLSFTREDNVVVQVLQNEDRAKGKDDVPTISVTDLSGIDLLIDRTKHNVVVAFCKKGEQRCPDDIYFTLDEAQQVLAQKGLNITYHFFVVECGSAKDVLKYELNSLPGYALYNRSKKTWRTGKGNVNYFMDILALIADETGFREILDTSPDDSSLVSNQPLYPPTFLQAKKDDDIYALLGRTLSPPMLPADLIFSDENFNERIMHFEKTAVLFYLQWSVESKVVLHHLLASWERLDRSQNVSLGALDCHSHTTTCFRFNLTSLPTLLLFTSSSSLDTPSPLPPSVATLNSVSILEALGQTSQQPQDTHATLMEVTPASLPILLRKNIATPLVLWCGDSSSTELGVVFGEIALAKSEVHSDFTFAWINSSEHSSLLSTVLAVENVSFPTVVAMRLDQSVVYQMMEAGHQLQAASFGEQLLAFLDQLKQGTLSPIRRLSHKKWLPLEPPFHFPSNLHPRQEDTGFEHTGGSKSDRKEFEDIGQLDLNTIPHDTPPQVKDYPMVEDQTHEEGSRQSAERELGEEFGQLNKDEL